MENIESLQAQLSLAGEIAVSHKNNILTDRIFLQISGRKQISAQQVINGTTVWGTVVKWVSIIWQFGKKNNLCLEDSIIKLLENNGFKPKIKTALSQLISMIMKWRKDALNIKHFEYVYKRF